MKVLVVYAHPNPKSFNHAILESFTKGLQQGGHTFEITDLYDIKFNPSLKLKELPQVAGESIAQDALDQQAKVTRADGLAFIFPVWWLSCPAILKGWIDRVLSEGFAFELTDKGLKGLLKHNKALLICTTGSPEQKYQALGMIDLMKNFFHQILNIDCGIANVEYAFLYGLEMVDDKTRQEYLEQAHHLGKGF